MAKHHLIDLVHIKKTFPDGFTALHDINLYIRKNEFLTLLGPSGCGKTTMLRIIGGFETPTSGEVTFDGENLLTLPPYKRRVNTVFQKYALFPNMNVEENIAFGLKLKKESPEIIKEKVEKMLALVNLKGYEKRAISSLSGGQQQRIAIARALVNEPEVLLLDEPLGALDLKLRKDMQIELKNMQQQLGITFIYVTHDQEEALTMSDTVVVMNNGEIQQIGTPEDIYNEPKNAFVADFIGESNIISGFMDTDYQVKFHNTLFTCVDPAFTDTHEIDVVLRPEDINVVKESEGQITGVVKNSKFLGVHYEMLIDSGEYTFKVQSTMLSEVGSTVGMVVEPDAIHVMRRSEVEE